MQVGAFSIIYQMHGSMWVSGAMLCNEDSEMIVERKRTLQWLVTTLLKRIELRGSFSEWDNCAMVECYNFNKTMRENIFKPQYLLKLYELLST